MIALREQKLDGSRTPKRILAIAPQPFFSPRGTPFSVYYRTLVTARAGAQIDLLTYGQGEDVDITGVRIIRIPRFGLRHVKIGPSITKAFLDVLLVLYTIGLLLCAQLRRGGGYDVVHAHEESVFWCRFLKPLFRFKLIYDMHSSLPQQLTNFKFTTSRLLIGAFDRLERTCLRNADAVITICPDLEEYALAHGVEPERHFLIENSIFEDVRIGGNRSEVRSERAAINGQRWMVSDQRSAAHRIVYAGTFEAYQGIDLLIRAFAEVAREREDVELILVGGSAAQVEAMRALARELGVESRCTFTGQLPKSQTKRFTSSASVLVSPRVDGTNTPLKVYEQLASGIPLVATRIWSHTQVLNDDVCILVEPEPQAMAEGLMIALDDEVRRDAVVRAARRLYERAYSRSAYESKLGRCLALLADGDDVAPARVGTQARVETAAGIEFHSSTPAGRRPLNATDH